ncbi:hypothetical protein [Streptomyces sp. URMC 124]
MFAYTSYRLTSSPATSLRTNALAFGEPHRVADVSVSRGLTAALD